MNQKENRTDAFKSVQEVLQPYKTVYAADKKPLKSKIIDTPIGPLVVVANEKSVLLVENVQSRHLDRELKSLSEVYSKSIIADDNDSKPLATIESELKAYFNGSLTEFQTPIDIGLLGTEFQRAVWMEIDKIPYGKTSTYTELAKGIGKPTSYRAVANACGRNPITVVIPCHRVLASGGAIGGYTGGVEKKVRLLDLEKKFKP